MYGCESWTVKKAERRRIDAFELWCWRRLLRVPWTARRSHQSILKEISPEYSLEGVMLKLKLQYLATWCKELTPWRRPWCWEILKAGEGDYREWDGWIASLTWQTWNKQAPRIGDGQGSLACCSPWGCKESDITEWLNWTVTIEPFAAAAVDLQHPLRGIQGGKWGTLCSRETGEQVFR